MGDAGGTHSRELYEHVLRRAMQHAMRIVGRAEALDVGHDVACELVRRRMQGADSPADPRSYDGLIYRAVMNRLSNVRRSATRRAAADRVYHDEREASSNSWAQPDARVDENELFAVVDAVIGDMPGAMRAVFLLVRRDGLSYRDAAQRLGVGVATVHTHLARANARLRDAITRYRGEQPVNARSEARHS
jgi:RNA polymerase sigma factor (sigma-70 family)